jgi:hypothetical protein
MTDAQKLTKIRDMCNHPGAFHWTGVQMANAIVNIINDNKPIDYELSEIDEPIHYELAHDAVFVDEEIK